MNTMDNAKVMEVLEKCTLSTYFEKLANANLEKKVLFSIFPYTAAANLSDPHYFVMIKDTAKIAGLNSGKFLN